MTRLGGEMTRHAAEMDAAGFWRQYPIPISFDTPGEEVAGALIEYQDYKNPAGDHYPKLRIQRRDGTIVIVIASQARLLAALCEEKPAVGDRIRIVYTGESDRAAFGLNKAKEFTVEVRRPSSQSQDRADGTSGKKTASESDTGTGENPK